MQRKTKLFMAGGVAALLAIGGLAGRAQADKAGGWGEGWHGMGGMHRMWGGHGRGGMMGQEMMQRYDTDKDGKLSPAEMMPANADEVMFARLDANADGSVTQDEIDAMHARMQERMKGGERGHGHGHHGKGHGGGWGWMMFGGDDAAPDAAPDAGN